ncbi:hypothetical protein IE992_15720 [Klebsiella pneumoniae]|uniref:Uncharacterized protein n=1 Tax=Klebsiella pneumoniae TaxID=573 RepID=A0A927HUF6_KLEPN|nr:hypothetical protein [Klebsiella pneumoniae]
MALRLSGLREPPISSYTPVPGKRSAAGQDTADTVPVFVPDGATLIRPTASSRKLLYRRPGKRSAAGR